MTVRLKKTDVAIVGLGAVGGVAALPLTRAGLEVTALEAGDWLTPADFAPDELHGEEIRCSYSSPMGFQKGAPGGAFVPRGCRLDTVFREDAFHGVSADLVAHVSESPANPRIAPA